MAGSNFLIFAQTNTPVMRSATPVKIFIAYARKDGEFLETLRAHMAPLIRSGRVQVWFDGLIEPGAVWDDTIKHNLHSAEIILLLISANSLSSDYFYGKEVADAMERHRAGTARVIPFILRSCLWQETELGTLQALPQDGVPVEKWTHEDDAYENTLQHINRIVSEIELRRQEADNAIQRSRVEQEPEASETVLPKQPDRHHGEKIHPATEKARLSREKPEELSSQVVGPIPQRESHLLNAAEKNPEESPMDTPGITPKWLNWLFSWVPTAYRKTAVRYGLIAGAVNALARFVKLKLHLNYEEFYTILPVYEFFWLCVNILLAGLALRAFRRSQTSRQVSFKQAVLFSLFFAISAAGIFYILATVLGWGTFVSFEYLSSCFVSLFFSGLILSPFFVWIKRSS